MTEVLKEKLFSPKKTGWEKIDEQEKNTIFSFCDNYISFLNQAKTERESISYARKKAEENGFREISTMTELHHGDKVYFVNREKSMYLAVIGEEPFANGLNILGAHVDSPRLDLKPNPLYEDTGFALFRTHYYGGIKKYQWVAIPLAIHGVVVKTNGEKVQINIGEEDSDPIFTITDLLPHLAMDQMDKKLKEAISGESLNLLIGSIPYGDNTTLDSVKLNILNILNQKYGITEQDFLSAELELVPAFKAKTLGFDGSMIAGYGQDDRVCAYTSLQAILEVDRPKKTSICILADKEETGSMGNTGMESQVFDMFVADLLRKTSQNESNILEKVYFNSKMLSADVDAGYDPLYPTVFEKNNAAYLGEGIGLNKYTGSRGKMGASDANAEYVAYVRNILERNNIPYNISELGKVDAGGGGTIAFILANKGIDVIDCGIPVLSMHSPYEVSSKVDVYTAYRTYKAFLIEA